MIIRYYLSTWREIHNKDLKAFSTWLSLVDISSLHTQDALMALWCRLRRITFFLFLSSRYFLSSLTALFRGSRGKGPPVRASELCRDTVCGETGQSRRN